MRRGGDLALDFLQIIGKNILFYLISIFDGRLYVKFYLIRSLKEKSYFAFGLNFSI